MDRWPRPTAGSCAPITFHSSQPVRQLATLSPGILWNSARFEVTKVQAERIASAAMRRSYGPIEWPADRRAARISDATFAVELSNEITEKGATNKSILRCSEVGRALSRAPLRSSKTLMAEIRQSSGLCCASLVTTGLRPRNTSTQVSVSRRNTIYSSDLIGGNAGWAGRLNPGSLILIARKKPRGHERLRLGIRITRSPSCWI